MSNLRKRFLALAIVAVMLVAALSSTAFASTSEFADISDVEETKMVKLLSALQIVLGRPADADGVKNFDRDALVTRQEMAMFLARINSATPGAFNDAEASAKVKLPFEDVTNPTFYLAIEYCHEKGIITGATADTFNPTANVTLDQALAMTIRALGYTDIDTSKNFIESTKKAKELGFALGYKDNEGSKKLTRIEVISILYKYFYSDEQSLEIVKNEFTGVQSVQRVSHPVMAKFGINVADAYIVRANDYTADVPVTLETPTGFGIKLPALQIPTLSAKDIAAGNNMVLAYHNFRVVTTSAADRGADYKMSDGKVQTDAAGKELYDNWTVKDGYTYSGKWTYIVTSKAEFGVSDKTNRDLVGLKVMYYQDTMAATRPEALGITSDIVGTKTPVDLSKVSTSWDIDKGYFKDTTKAFTIEGTVYDTSASVNTYSGTIKAFSTNVLYGFNTSAELRRVSTIEELAKFVAKGQKNFGLEYVVNSSDEAYYIFTPYSVGYYRDDKKEDNDTRQRYVFNGGPGNLWFVHRDASQKIKVEYIGATDGKGKEVNSLAKGNAYLYTVEGQNLNIFKQLEKVFTDKYPEYIYNETLGIKSDKGLSLSIKLDGQNQYIAKNATTSATLSTSVYKDADNNREAIGLGGKYSGFAADADSAVFYVVSTSGATGLDSGKKYGVLDATPTSVTNYLGTNKYMYMYSIFTYENNRVENMTSEVLVTPYDYYSTNSLQAGQLVSYQQIGEYYRIGAYDDTKYLYDNNTNVLNGHVGGVNDNKDGGRSGNNVRGLLSGGNGVNAQYRPYSDDVLTVSNFANTKTLMGRVTDNSVVLVSEYRKVNTVSGAINNLDAVGSTLRTENYINTRKFTKAEFDRFMNDSQRTGQLVNVEMITDYSGSGSISLAKVIHLSIIYDGNLSADYSDNYLVITSKNIGYGNSSYGLVSAYDYKNTTLRQVAVPYNSGYTLGTVVRMTANNYTFFGSDNKQYYVVDAITNTTAGTPAQNALGKNYVGGNNWNTSDNGAITLQGSIYNRGAYTEITEKNLVGKTFEQLQAYAIARMDQNYIVHSKAKPAAFALQAPNKAIYVRNATLTLPNGSTVTYPVYCLDNAVLTAPGGATDDINGNSSQPNSILYGILDASVSGPSNASILGATAAVWATGSSWTVAVQARTNGARYTDAEVAIFDSPVMLNAATAAKLASVGVPSGSISAKDIFQVVIKDTVSDAANWTAGTLGTPPDIGDWDVLYINNYYEAVSVLNRDAKINRVQVKLKADGVTIDSVRLASTDGKGDFGTTTVEFNKADWINDAGNKATMNTPNQTKYYLITNNVNNALVSEVVTIIEVIPSGSDFKGD